MEFVSVWDEAGRDAEAEAGLRALTAARVRAAAFWPFLAAATDTREYEHREALASSKIIAAADAGGVEPEALAQSLRDDFATVLASRLHVVGSYYVTTSDGEKVGGPYDSESDAQDAIDGGDVTGENLSVSNESDGGDADSDSDSGDDSDDKDAPPQASDGDDSGEDTAPGADEEDDAEGSERHGFDADGFKKGSSSLPGFRPASDFGPDPSEVATAGFAAGAQHAQQNKMHDPQGAAHERLSGTGATQEHHEIFHRNYASGYSMTKRHQFADVAGGSQGFSSPNNGHMSSLFPVVALQEGEDPLLRIVNEVPPGPGVAEKEIRHGEYEEHPDNSLVSQYTAVYRRFAN